MLILLVYAVLNFLCLVMRQFLTTHINLLSLHLQLEIPQYLQPTNAA
jgi:hypothetical protein